MATPTLKTQPVTIELTYDFKTRKVSFPDHLRSKKHHKNLKVEPGDELKFTCEQGSLDLLLSPAGVFEPTEFKTGGAPVKVLRAIKPGEEAMIECGGTFKYKKGPLDPEEIITIIPKTEGYGVTPET